MRLNYKVWDKAKKKMLHWDSDFAYITSHSIVLLNSGGMVMPPNAETLLYSGLPDRNGKEICEGDILDSQSGNKFKVVFEYGCFMKQHIGDDRPMGYLHEVAESFWIIGNIYENSELLLATSQSKTED